VVFFGDSITLGFYNSPAWELILKKYNALNFGVGGDRTQHLLWRLDHGELDFKQDPRCVVVMIGTNNLDSNSPKEIASGVLQAVERFLARFPKAKVLVVGIPPRSKLPSNPIRLKRDELNQILKEVISKRQQKVLSFIPFPNLLTSDGVFTRDYTIDFVHLNVKANQILVNSLMEAIDKALST